MDKITEYLDEFITHAMLPSIWIWVIHGYLHEIRASFGADRGRLFTTTGAPSGASIATAT